MVLNSFISQFYEGASANLDEDGLKEIHIRNFKCTHRKNSGVEFNTPGVVRGPHQIGVISTPVGVSLILLGVKFNTGWCENGIQLFPIGVEINTNLVWTSHNTGVLNLTPEFLQCN